MADAERDAVVGPCHYCGRPVLANTLYACWDDARCKGGCRYAHLDCQHKVAMGEKP